MLFKFRIDRTDVYNIEMIIFYPVLLLKDTVDILEYDFYVNLYCSLDYNNFNIELIIEI